MSSAQTRNKHSKKGKHMTRKKTTKKSCVIKNLPDGNVRISYNGKTYNTHSFHICPASVATLKTIAKTSPSRCIKFAQMEDQFLRHEINAVCDYKLNGKCIKGKASYDEMKEIDAKMKSEFGIDKFGYHKMHLTTALQCVGPSPASKMSVPQLQCLTQSGGANPGDVRPSWNPNTNSKISQSKRDLFTEMMNDKPQGPSQIAFQGSILSPINIKNIDNVGEKAAKYLELIKNDNSEKGQFRKMCMYQQLTKYISDVNNAKPANLKSSKASNKIKEIIAEVKTALGRGAIDSDACSKIMKASSENRPVAVEKDVSRSSEEDIQKVIKQQVDKSVQEASMSAINKIKEEEAKAQANIQKEANKDLSLESKLISSTGSNSSVSSDDSTISKASTIAAPPSQTTEQQPQKPVLANTTTPATTSQTQNNQTLPLTESEKQELKCTSKDIKLDESKCSPEQKRIIEKLLSPETNDACSAEATKLREQFESMCNRVITKAIPKPPVSLPSAPTTPPPPPSEVSDVTKCPSLSLNIGDWICNASDKEKMAILEKLSVDKNQGCADLAKRKLDKLKTVCKGFDNVKQTQSEAQQKTQSEAQPEAQQETQQEAQPEAQQETQQEAQPEAQQETQPEAQQETQPEAQQETQPEAQPETQPEEQDDTDKEEDTDEPEDMPSVTTSTSKPKDGYNEITITVRIPSKFQQTTTGSAGMTFAGQMKEMTTGGSKKRRLTMTPKRKQKNDNKLIYRKSIKHKSRQ